MNISTTVQKRIYIEFECFLKNEFPKLTNLILGLHFSNSEKTNRIVDEITLAIEYNMLVLRKYSCETITDCLILSNGCCQ